MSPVSCDYGYGFVIGEVERVGSSIAIGHVRDVGSKFITTELELELEPGPESEPQP